jgi:hypothetical protein
MRGKMPTPLRPIREEPRHWHVVVALHPDARNHIGEVPFRTVLLEWKLEPDPTALPEDQTEEQMEALFKAVAVRVRDLMQTLRGADAR